MSNLDKHVDAYFDLKESITSKRKEIKEMNNTLKELEILIINEMNDRKIEEFESQKNKNYVYIKNSLVGNNKKKK